VREWGSMHVALLRSYQAMRRVQVREKGLIRMASDGDSTYSKAAGDQIRKKIPPRRKRLMRQER
jgi:hypothetical protein